MRRWLCMVVLLFALAGQGGTVSRVADPVPIERPLSPSRAARLERTPAWWSAS